MAGNVDRVLAFFTENAHHWATNKQVNAALPDLDVRQVSYCLTTLAKRGKLVRAPKKEGGQYQYKLPDKAPPAAQEVTPVRAAPVFENHAVQIKELQHRLDAALMEVETLQKIVMTLGRAL